MKSGRKLAVVVLLASGCAGYEEGVGLEVRFASRQQAQVSGDGLPADLASLRVEARQGGLQGTLIDDGGCLDLSAGDARRQSLTLDLTAGEDRTIVVKGWRQAGCPSASADWLGATLGVDVPSGKRLTVPVFVTRRGLRLNLARDELEPARAFASATPLADGRVLIAGGYDALQADAQTAALEATDRAVLYDPTTGSFSTTGSLSESRGAHEALRLPDGRVLLVGGAKKLIVQQRPGGSFQILQQEPLWTADLYDPTTGRFEQAGLTELLARLETAAVAGPDGTVYLLGGKTSSHTRTADVVIGRASGGTWQWNLSEKTLLSARRGARAVMLGTKLLVAGGMDSGGVPAEVADFAGLVFQAVPGMEAYPGLDVVGHSLDSESPERSVLAGGISPNGLQEPASSWTAFWLLSGEVSVNPGTLITARAYHAAGFTGPGLILGGGVGADFALQKTLELAVSQQRQPAVLEDSLTCASLGVATALLPEGSLLFSGGLGRDDSGHFVLCSETELLSP